MSSNPALISMSAFAERTDLMSLGSKSKSPVLFPKSVKPEPITNFLSQFVFFTPLQEQKLRENTKSNNR